MTTLDPFPPPPPPVWPVAVALVLVFVLAQVLGLAFGLVLAFASPHGPPSDAGELVTRLQEALFTPVGFLGSIAMSGGLLAGAALLGSRLGREYWRDRLRLRLDRVRPHHLLLATLGVVGFGQVLDSLVALMGWTGWGVLGMMTDVVAALSGPGILAAVVLVGLVAGTAEELFFRGFVQTRLSQRFGPWLAIGATALVFGAFHCDPLHSPLAVGLGLYLGWLTERAGTIVPAIAAHSANNALWVVLVAFGPEEMSAATHVVLALAAGTVGALATWSLARAYAPAAARTAPPVFIKTPPGAGEKA
jgi:uncharacterized protein